MVHDRRISFAAKVIESHSKVESSEMDDDDSESFDASNNTTTESNTPSNSSKTFFKTPVNSRANYKVEWNKENERNHVSFDIILIDLFI